MNVYDIIKKPVVTEKTELLRKEYNKYTFEVHPKANKIEIKKAVESIKIIIDFKNFTIILGFFIIFLIWNKVYIIKPIIKITVVWRWEIIIKPTHNPNIK